MAQRLTVNNAPRKDAPPMNAARDAAIAADYRAGMPVLEILLQHEIGTAVLYRAVNDADRALHRAARAEKAAKRDAAKTRRDAAIAADYRAGMPVIEILLQYEISTPALYRAVKNADCALRRAARANARAEEAAKRDAARARRKAAIAALDAAIIADYRTGMPIAELCRKHNRHPRTIYHTLRRNGVPPNRGRKEPGAPASPAVESGE